LTRTLAPVAGLVVALCLGAPAHAALRSPQIPVSGTALQAYFSSLGQLIDVHTQQLDLQTVSLRVGTTIEFRMPLGSDPNANVLGIYNAGLGAPPLDQVFPGAATTGWYAVLSFRSSPMRAVVYLFDASSALQGTSSYLGVDPSYLGFYLQSLGATFYSQDERNGGARLLAFNGIGTLAGSTWFAWETGPGPGGDFADSIWLVPNALAPVPVSHTSWGALKQRFR
jgi:hypothetical protein